MTQVTSLLIFRDCGGSSRIAHSVPAHGTVVASSVAEQMYHWNDEPRSKTENSTGSTIYVKEDVMKSLIPWRRFEAAPFEGFRNEMERMMQRFFGEPIGGNGATAIESWSPRVDMEETDKEVLVKADLPGVDPKNIDISVTGDVLVIRGDKKEEREEKNKNYHRIERFQGDFYREISLPPGADPEKITAASDKGVITITIPKKAGVQPRKIPVKA